MSDGKKLSSWKEIAGYLDIAVRTAQRWERIFGLPVHRIDEAHKSYVFAYTDEIDRWLQEKDRRGELSRRHFIKNKKFIYGIISLVFLALIMLSFFTILRTSSVPYDFKITGSLLEIYNSLGKKLWSYDCRVALDESKYSLVAKQARVYSFTPKYVFFEDIDKDGHLNVIAAVKSVDGLEERVICFDHEGKELWSFFAGKKIKYGDYQYSSDLELRLVRLADLDGDGLSEVVIIAVHKMFFPARLLIISHDGKVKGEYWNSGHLTCVGFLDLNNDGIREIILGGVNNEYLKACLIVLNPQKVEGSSPQERGTKYYSNELDRGTEEYYLIIPQDEVGELLNIFDVAYSIDFIDNDRILLSTKFSRAIYEFDYQLRSTYLYFGDEFSAKHRQLEKEGKINTPVSEIDKDKLLSGIIYWDGMRWTNTPTMTNRWKKLDAHN